jgi:GT2 family glycosyltransferase
VDPNFLNPMADALSNDNSSALAGPSVVSYDEGGTILTAQKSRVGLISSIIFLTPLKHLFEKTFIVKLFYANNKAEQKVYVVSGCCMLFKRDALEMIGLFDETTFLGSEEYIMAEKLASKGLSTYYVPGSVIRHKVGRSTAKIDPVEKQIAFMESDHYYQRKYLKMPVYKKAVLGMIRMLIFSLFAAVSGEYRKNFFKLMSAVWRGV